MFCIGGRTYYAEWKGMLFNFESVMDRNYFVAHLKDAKIVPSQKAYKHDKFLDTIRVYASTALGANVGRKKRIRKWFYANK